MSRTFIIDSRNRESDAPTNDFVLNLNPPLEDIGAVKLLYCSIPVVEGADQLYWCVSIRELGLNARGSNRDTSKCTFVIPVMSGGGYRSFFNSGSSFVPKSNGADRDISQMHIALHYPDGSPVSTNDEDFIIVLELD